MPKLNAVRRNGKLSAKLGSSAFPLRGRRAGASEHFYAVVLIVIIVLAALAGALLYLRSVPPKETTVFATLQSESQFSDLTNALSTAGLASTLSGSSPYTIFAPTNSAFSSLPPGMLSSLFSNVTRLTSVLRYQIVAGKVNESSMYQLTSLTTLQGSPLPIGVAGSSLVVGGNGSLAQSEIHCTNGVIHPITSLIVPPQEVSATLGTMSILQTAEAMGLTYLVQGLQTSNLALGLTLPGNFTLLAPNNNAMSAFTCTNPYANCLADLMANASALTSVMQDNILPGAFTSAQLVELGSVTTLQGQTLPVTTSASGAISVGTAALIQVDIKCTNGYIDITNAVIVPPGSSSGFPNGG